jgi:hypothetical protein
MSRSTAMFEFVDDLTGFRAPDWIVVRLPGRLTRKQDLLRALAVRLKFPGYFGYNWDALEECLNDLSWLGQQARIVILHKHVPLRDDEQRRTYCNILRQTVADRKDLLRVIFPESARSEIEKYK